MPEHHEEEPSDLESGLEHEETAGEDAPKPKLDAKDPLRPRRKKARRACFACQRAHLTCGMFCVFFPMGFLLSLFPNASAQSVRIGPQQEIVLDDAAKITSSVTRMTRSFSVLIDSQETSVHVNDVSNVVLPMLVRMV